MDSWEQFWGSSLACFILGAYSIVGSIYAYNTSNDPDENKTENKEGTKK